MNTEEPYKIFSEFYEDFIAKNCPALHGLYFDFLAGIIKENRLKHDSILDASCGTGILMKMLSEAGFNVTGMDINPHMLSKAKSKGLDVFQGDIRDFDVQRKFDIIYSFDSLDHLNKDGEFIKALDSVGRNLNPGGGFIFDCDEWSKTGRMVNECYTYDSDTYSFVWKNHCVKEGLIDIEIRISKKTGLVFEEFVEHHLVGEYELDEVKHELESNGFRVIYSSSEKKTKTGALSVASIFEGGSFIK